MEAQFDTHIQVVAVIATAIAFLVVFELVRRRRLVERYALLWMVAASALVVLAVWRDGLKVVADVLGVANPANAIFLLAFAVVFTLLLHFSIATSRLSDETKILSQEVARLDGELRAMRAARDNGETEIPDSLTAEGAPAGQREAGPSRSSSTPEEPG